MLQLQLLFPPRHTLPIPCSSMRLLQRRFSFSSILQFLPFPKFCCPSICGRRISFPASHTHQTQSNSPPLCSTFNHEIPDFFDHLIRHTTSIRQPNEIHAQILLTGSPSSPFLAARLVSAYARFGSLTYARKVFETNPSECVSSLLLWNSILRANLSYGEYEEVIRLYFQMWKLGVGADGYTFPLVVRAFAMMGDLKLCKIVHCHVLLLGFQSNLHVGNELLGMYGKMGQMDVARLLFDRMVVRSYISWNTMVSGLAQNHDSGGAVEMFCRMESDGLEPNSVTWTSLLSSHARCGLHEETLKLYGTMRSKGVEATAEALAVVISVCADLRVFDKGVVVHGYATRGGFENYSMVKNSLICMYGKNGAAEAAESLFSEMESKNLVTWNALISSFAESGLCDKAFAKFSELEKLHGRLTQRPDVVSWTAVITGFSSMGRLEESLELFRKMQIANVLANSITFSSVLSACADLSALHLGREIHAHAIRILLDKNNLVGNGLIHMYTKCGTLREGHLAFERIDGKDIFSWNMVIGGYGVHGLGDNALRLFDQMIKAGYKPDGVTFVAVLSACSHAGLVTEGRKLFDQMEKRFGIKPLVEHYACMVDLLGRAGFLQEANNIVRSMPIKPNACVWGALLNSCRVHKNTDVADEIASQVMSLNLKTTGNFMLLSNIYAAGGRWKDSAKVRMSAKIRGLKKLPGQSWIEVKKKIHMFSAGNATRKGMEEVHRILAHLSLQIAIDGFFPDKIFLLTDVEEEALLGM